VKEEKTSPAQPERGKGNLKQSAQPDGGAVKQLRSTEGGKVEGGEQPGHIGFMRFKLRRANWKPQAWSNYLPSVEDSKKKFTR